MGDAVEPGRPIVLLGLCKRTGTNFVAHLLRRHPDIGTAPPVWEHFLLDEAHLLTRYAARTRAYWAPRWGDLDELERDLAAHLGAGALRFLTDRCPSPRLVAKCPSVTNLELAPRLFGGADLIVLVRDGRSVAASLSQGFGWTLERSVQTWAQGAAAAVAFLDRWQEPADPGPADLRVHVARYEDLVDAGPGLDALLEFCRLDPGRYDREAAASMPVYGSSFEREEGEEVSWKGSARSADFDPTTRFAHWGPAEHRRFDWVAGALNERLGYDRTAPTDDGRRTDQRLLDVVWPARRQLTRLGARVERLRGSAR